MRSGICQQVVLEGDKADLTRLPIIQCWPLDGNLRQRAGVRPAPPRATSASSAAPAGTSRSAASTPRTPITGDRNIGMYRVQQFGPRKCAMHWHMHHDGARHFRLYQKRGEKMPLAIVLGGESVLPYAATAPLPPGIEEHAVRRLPQRPRASSWSSAGRSTWRCRPTPRSSSRGTSIPNEKLMEGPFGDHTGFYSLADWYPAFHVTAITHRKNPIYPTTIVGKPPMEDYFLGKATERVFLPLLRMLIPDIVDYACRSAACSTTARSSRSARNTPTRPGG